ncbi:MAG: dihydrolipoyl dehydrogenase [Arenimonas sp.]|uniref:dihydrolipoyl dehydrogenase n=1 Tax=Arenimonas sp. TaxID=1872635 RepID=UPI0025B7D86A|nr:dihydrolipoyl dehydrogenase [Arenimonas sp.]MBW8367590.1 dihydrolipoyl dehydrogenase [Arenimonas sp.]
MKNIETVDVAIIGAGSAGLAALRQVRKRTESFVIINDGAYGTTCARVGCMPSKALIEAAHAFHARRRLGTFGIRGGEALSVDLPAVMARVRELRDFFVAGVVKATDALDERSIAGRARLLGAGHLAVGEREFRAKRIILAPGSHPIVPGPWRAFGDRVQTSDSIFELPTLPPRVAVIGLGAIGIEFAQAMAQLGIQVTAFGRGTRLAGLTDSKVNAAMRAVLDQQLTLCTDGDAELSEAEGGIAVSAGNTRVVVDQVLVAIGRRPNLQGIGLASLGVALDERGMPPWDPTTTRIGDLDVFLAGDANGHAALLHEAADEGYIAGYNAVADDPTCFARRTPIGIVFAEPGIATVGQRHADIAPGTAFEGEVDFSRQGRSRVAQRNVGLLRIYAAREGGKLLGAEMCAPAAEHMVHLLALAIGQGLSVQDLLRLPFYHPVIEEGLRTALRDLASHYPMDPSDLASCPSSKAEALS